MTKTQRRRAARQRAVAAHDASITNPLDSAAAIGLLDGNNERWRQVQNTLSGLLAIEFTSPFIDRENKCPERAHLIVHLDRVHKPGSPTTTISNVNDREVMIPNLQQRVAQALNAVATLCIAAQYLSQCDDLYERLWQRVGESEMLEEPLEASKIETWVRFTKARGIPLLLSWRRKPFEPSQLFEPLREFLSTPRPTGCETPSMAVTVGLRFVEAEVTSSVLRALHELLVIPEASPESLLVDPTCLRTLWFDWNRFYAPELNVLTAMLCDPLARRIDELAMVSVVIDAMPVATNPGFLEALSRFFTSIFDAPENIPPVSLSLGGNEFEAEHLDALREAIATGTRSLGALTLSNLSLVTEDAWKSLAALVFTPLPNVTPTAILDLSMLENRYIPGLGSLVLAAIESFASSGAIRDARIQCIFNGATLCHRPHGKQLEATTSPGVFYTIEDFHSATKFVKISVSATNAKGDAESVAGWVPSSTISQLRRDNVDMIGCSFTRLIFDPSYYDRTSSRTILHLASAMGSRLKGLSLQNHSPIEERLSAMSSSLPEILLRCPGLEDLSLEGSQLTMGSSLPFWADPTCETPRSLAVLHLGHCGLRDVNFQGLSGLPLQHLSLPGNPIGANGVESLLVLLQTKPSLEFVELTPQSSDPPALCLELRAQIDELLGHEYLHAREKAAVLSVLAHIQHLNPQLPYPGNDIVASVFAFAGTKPRRVVKWAPQ